MLIVSGALRTIPSQRLDRKRNWKLVEESRLSKPQQCWDRIEYREESWRSEICSRSDCSEIPPTQASVKNSSGEKEGEVMDLFGIVWFYDISTIICYLMLNPLYISSKYMICNPFVDNIFKWGWPHFFAHS